MIDYENFKKLFNVLNNEPEIEVYFKNSKNTYMIIKYKDYITFQRCGIKEKQSGEIKFTNIDELYNSKTIDNIFLKQDWSNVKDILINSTFSVVDDKEDIKKIYGIDLI